MGISIDGVASSIGKAVVFLVFVVFQHGSDWPLKLISCCGNLLLLYLCSRDVI